MKKVLSILLFGILVAGLTGCGNNNNNIKIDSNNNSVEKETSTSKEDNKELVDTFNNTYKELYNEAKEKGYYSLALYNITDRLKEKRINEYKVLAICDKAFTKKVDLDTWTYTEENIPDYDGKCTYDTWVFTEYNKGKDYNILVLDANNDYYNVTISFKKIKFNDKNRYYPTFKNSKLLK